LKIKQEAQSLRLPFSTVKVMYLHNFDKNGLGYILGDFFTNSSGHPGCEAAWCANTVSMKMESPFSIGGLFG
jgi:hypothetical protein